MADDYAQLGEHARLVMTFAQEEALRNGHDHVLTEDLLAGMMNHAYGSAMLAALNVPVPPNVTRPPMSQIETTERPLGLAPEVRHALELAREELDDPDLRSDAVGLEHLLVGLLREETGVSGRILRDNRRLTPEHVRRSIVDAEIRAAQMIDAGAELRIWGMREQIDRLLALASQSGKSVDILVWEAIEQTWFPESGGQSSIPKS